jgi:phenylacetate-CoA ligase
MQGAPGMTTVVSTMPGVLWPAIPGPRGLMRLGLLQQLSESQWWPAERVQATQLAQINALWAHVRLHSPHFARLAAHLPATLTEADWATLPVLSRDTVQAQGDQIRCSTFPGAHGQRQAVNSSGSTGKPVSTEQTDLSTLFWEAFTLREHAWHRRDLSGKLGALRYFPDTMAAAQTGGHGPNWGAATDGVYQTGPVAMLGVKTTVQAQLAWLNREDPDYLLTHPTVLASLLDAVDGGQTWARTRLREVRTLSEQLPEGLRERCQAALGVPLVDMYSARETGYMALQCPDHPHYHVQSEGARVEVLHDDGRPCAPGEIGRVVVTPLHNFAFPLLRYDIGDLAQVGQPCPCGRGLPVLARIMGRQRNMLTFPDGRRVWPYLRHDLINGIVPVQQLRMTQHTVHHIELELVTPQRPDAAVEARLRQAIRGYLGHDFELSFAYPEHIARSAGGKFEDFVSLVP